MTKNLWPEPKLPTDKKVSSASSATDGICRRPKSNRRRESKCLPRFLCAFSISVLFPIAVVSSATSAEKLPIEKIKLPPGFKIEIYASGVPNARSMTFGDKGTLFVGTRTEGNVYAIIDADHDNKADRVITILKGMRSPNGVAFKDGSLYVAEVSNIWRLDDIENHLGNPPKPVLVSHNFPTDGHHGWKFIRFGPDEKLYIPVGAPCNVCERDDLRYASICG